ncbi:MAG TPA: transglutaminase domain-containing protein, partial [Opitutaceae bacterium]|nr:transglutaminase domain-containing protein [Opitutaceae bacterium]
SMPGLKSLHESPRWMRHCAVLLLAPILCCAASPAPAATAVRAVPASGYLLPGGSRTFSIAYVAHVPAQPAGTRRLRIWIPVPRDSAVQSIRDLSFSAPPTLASEPKYGDQIAYWEINHPTGPTTLTMRFVCTRREVRTDLTRLALAGDGVDPTISFATYRRPARLIIVDVRIRRLAAHITAGRSTTLAKARAIYGYVLTHMRYAKSKPGWGTGSTAYACTTGQGNCTDFHSLFISLCRAAGIASEFEIGLYLPYDRHSTAPVSGYHCWAYFRVPGRTWVPVDCSEGWLEPGRREYFFGDHTPNRVTLSVGRDLVLAPAQAGPPLNYFIEPYAEADGRPVPASKTWTFHDLN